MYGDPTVRLKMTVMPHISAVNYLVLKFLFDLVRNLFSAGLHDANACNRVALLVKPLLDT